MRHARCAVASLSLDNWMEGDHSTLNYFWRHRASQ